jgi:hypothetical protein
LKKKGKNLRSYEQNKLLFCHPNLQPLGSFSHVVAYRSSLKKYKKNEFTTHFEQKNSPQANTKSKFDVLCIAKNLVI